MFHSLAGLKVHIFQNMKIYSSYKPFGCYRIYISICKYACSYNFTFFPEQAEHEENKTIFLFFFPPLKNVINLNCYIES